MRKKVFATSWHQGGMKPIAPVIKKLREENKVDVVVVGYDVSKDVLNSEKIKYKTIEDYGLGDVSKNSIEKILLEEKPDFVLTGTSVQDEKHPEIIEHSSIYSAKKLGIPSLSVLDVWMHYSMRFDDINTNEKLKYLPDKIAIMDNIAKREMIEEGFDVSVLEVTGNPNFDAIVEKSKNFTKNQREEIRNKIGMNKKILGYHAGSVYSKTAKEYGFYDLDIIKLIGETINDFKEIKENSGLVVRLHPRYTDDFGPISEYIKKNNKENIKIIQDIDSKDLSLSTEFSSTAVSTSAIEVVYMGKPSISLQPNLKCQDYLKIVTNNKIIPAGYTVEDCKEIIKNVFTSERYRNSLVKMASSFRPDGKATEKVIDLIYKMMK